MSSDLAEMGVRGYDPALPRSQDLGKEARRFMDESSSRIGRLTWAFVGLGVLLRVARYAMDFPLWWDEAFVGVNLLRRGYLDLLRPLDYGQVCPLLFLWIELSAVKLLGFSEWSLRLFPMACGVGSVFLFRHVSGRVMSGVPRLLSVALFAVSFYPIRHSADLKPYASDLLASLVLIALAFEWMRDRERSNWIWALAVAGPIAVGLSHPAIFVAGGIGLALLPSVRNTRRSAHRIALATFGLATVGTFLALFAAFTQGQARATLPMMASEWADSFPPLTNPLRLAGWLIATHTGDLFSYPFGAFRLASVLTSGLVATAAVTLWRSRQRTALAVCLLPFAMGLMAAALHRYPYGGSAHGGSARFMQYLAPSICLMTGFGASVAIDRVRSPRRKARLIWAGLVGLAAAGVAPVAIDFPHPYRAIQARRSREFAREFWPSMAKDARVRCLRWDVGIGPWESIHLNVAVALCNQAIYSPARRPGRRDNPISVERFILCDAHPEDEIRLKTWLDSMTSRHDLTDSRTIILDVGEPGGRKAEERYRLFEFAPKIHQNSPQRAVEEEAGPRREVRGRRRSWDQADGAWVVARRFALPPTGR